MKLLVRNDFLGNAISTRTTSKKANLRVRLVCLERLPHRGVDQSLEHAKARISETPEAGLPAPRPYPTLAKAGRRWIIEVISASWPTGSEVSGVLAQEAHRPGQAMPHESAEILLDRRED